MSNGKKVEAVCLFITNLGIGGWESIVVRLLSELSKHFKVGLFLLEDVVEYDIPDGVKIHILPSSFSKLGRVNRFLFLPFHSFFLSRICKKEGYQVCMSFLNIANYISIFSKVFRNPVKVLASHGGTSSITYKSFSFRSILSKLMLRFFYPFADKVIANSRGVQHDLCEHFGVPNTMVVHNLLDLANIELMRKIPLDEKVSNRLKIVHCGRFVAEKNHKLLLEAFSRLENDNVELWLIGKGELWEECKSTAKSLGIGDRVIFWGFIDNLYQYLNACDIFVLSSRQEGFPNAIIEGMACECAVVSTDCRSGPRELLCDGDGFLPQCDAMELADYGILVPEDEPREMAKAIDFLISKPDKLNLYKEKSHERVTEFSAEKIMEQYFKEF
jgi:N-acetylgalactosamine-N,N'-diacetylbacillosaminyl-diphospho-undecaprenol 4-alpha-N-acetylgalactosaminyltransferase